MPLLDIIFNILHILKSILTEIIPLKLLDKFTSKIIYVHLKKKKCHFRITQEIAIQINSSNSERLQSSFVINKVIKLLYCGHGSTIWKRQTSINVNLRYLRRSSDRNVVSKGK